MKHHQPCGYNFTFPHFNEPVFIAHPHGVHMNDEEKTAFAYKFLRDCVFPAYDKRPKQAIENSVDVAIKIQLNEPAGRNQSADLVETLLVDKDIWVEAVASNIGVARWFKGFVQSDEFGTLSSEEKGAAFDLFMNLETGMQILQENLLQIDAAETAIA